MKRTYFAPAFLMLSLLGFGAFKADTQSAAAPQVAPGTAAQAKKTGPQIAFKIEEHDFGKIREGVVAEFDFKYTNTGTTDLVLTDVRPSCGCTTPDWSRAPLAPGKTAVIKVKYNSAGRPGAFHKSISVLSNIPDETKVLFIKGEVVKATDNMQQDPNQSPVRIGG